MFQRMILVAIRGYQRGLSPFLGPCCRFEPSCSEYTRVAVERHGAARGLYLGMRRILRCQPLSQKYGSDPVPPAD
ncbi:MAG: membrane protein insertion efficiency factor YidD [Gemmatimonadetes bacterium]|nr:membrane protein insertion efficiency factor YidD [Gemmatimonadota bacterium]